MTKKHSLTPDPSTVLQRVYKVVFVGDSGVGKSSFIHRYCYEIWKPSYTATIGEFCLSKVSIILIRDDPYWTSRKKCLELIELSSINKVSLV